MKVILNKNKILQKYLERDIIITYSDMQLLELADKQEAYEIKDGIYAFKDINGNEHSIPSLLVEWSK
jgi:hypothetical protein